MVRAARNDSVGSPVVPLKAAPECTKLVSSASSFGLLTVIKWRKPLSDLSFPDLFSEMAVGVHHGDCVGMAKLPGDHFQCDACLDQVAGVGVP